MNSRFKNGPDYYTETLKLVMSFSTDSFFLCPFVSWFSVCCRSRKLHLWKVCCTSKKMLTPEKRKKKESAARAKIEKKNLERFKCKCLIKLCLVSSSSNALHCNWTSDTLIRVFARITGDKNHIWWPKAILLYAKCFTTNVRCHLIAFLVVNWFLKAPKKGHKCNYCSNETL